MHTSDAFASSEVTDRVNNLGPSRRRIVDNQHQFWHAQQTLERLGRAIQCRIPSEDLQAPNLALRGTAVHAARSMVMSADRLCQHMVQVANHLHHRLLTVPAPA